MDNEFNRNFEGDIKFAHGFEAAREAYQSLSWWERLLGRPIGYARLDYTTGRCSVDYRDSK
jgi:hypothetical protein